MMRKKQSKLEEITVRFKGTPIFTLAAGALNFPLAPTAAGLGIPFLTTESDGFEKFCFLKLKVRLLCDAGSTAGDSTVSFVGKPITTAGVSTILQASETQNFSLVTTKMTVHGNWFNIPKETLQGLLPWYQTQGGTAGSDTEEDNQGIFYLTGSGTSTLRVEFVGTLRLGAPVDPANSPLWGERLLRAKADLAHREELGKQLVAQKDAAFRAKVIKALAQQDGPTNNSQPATGFVGPMLTADVWNRVYPPSQ